MSNDVGLMFLFFPEFFEYVCAIILWLVYCGFIFFVTTNSQNPQVKTMNYVLVKPEMSREKVVVDVDKLVLERDEAAKTVGEFGKKTADLRAGLERLESHMDVGDIASKLAAADVEHEASLKKLAEVNARCTKALEKLTLKASIYQGAIDKLGKSIFGPI